jgi:large subunit ribosomal protein L2
MPNKEFNPVTAGQRHYVRNQQELAQKRPERRLTESKHSPKGRNTYGRITSRRRGGGHKRLYRVVDFRRDKLDVPARVSAIEYDPNRTANLALLVYADGDKRYIPAPNRLEIGDTVISCSKSNGEFRPGNSFPLSEIPPATRLHCIEMEPGAGARIARGAGTGAQLINVDGDRATLKMPSGEIRMVHSRCRATIGQVGNLGHSNQSLGKAGRNRWKGRRPRVRGVAMNPVDHPMGGGEGRTSGGGHPVSPWGQLSKGYPTRRKSKTSNSMILVRRNGRKMKR